MKTAPLRIVSLLPSTTEMVCALGLATNLVGRSHECDFPPSVRALPVCTEARLRVDASSREINQHVRTILEQAVSIYRVDAELLRELRPTHIITQTQCEVCAVSLKDVENALQEWLGATSQQRPQLISVAPFALADLWTDIQRLAEAFDVADRGRALVATLQVRMAGIVEKARLLSRPTVACIEWLDPLMASGNWMPELVERAGGRNLFGEAGKHAPWMEWHEVVSADPDVLLVLPCGFDIARIRSELPLLTSRSGWEQLRAVRDGRVYLLDGNQYFNRPGPQLVESLEILAEILHPEAFHFGHRDSDWQPAD